MATLNVGGSAPSASQKLDIVAGLGLIGCTAVDVWANRATLAAAGHTCVFFTDIGVGGTEFILRSGKWRPRAGRYVNTNNINSVTHTLTTRAVVGYSGFLPGQVQDGDIIRMRWLKVMTGASGAETDTTETAVGTATTTYGTDLGLTTAGLTNTNVAVAAMYEWRRLNTTTLRALSIGGSSGSGAAGGIFAVTADVTNTPDMDALTWYLQLSAKLTSGAVSATSVLRGFQVEVIAGA